MTVSVITVCFNNQHTIADTINSVAIQDYPYIEHIIVDGLSTDQTHQVIEEHASSITRYISEKDQGIYDAMNKGIKAAKGNLIAFLNADDFFADATVVSGVVKCMEAKNADGVYGNLVFVDPEDTSRVTRKWVAGFYKEKAFEKGWMPPHPTFFVKKKVFEKYGGFNLKLKSAADYELMLRLIHIHQIKITYLDKVLVRMRTGGKSNASIKNRLNANREDMLAWELNGLKCPPFLRIAKPLRKLSQFLFK